MTHQMQTTALDEIGELLAEQGFDGLADALRVLLNEVMKLERAAVLKAAPYQRAEGRTGYANGFKPKTVQTRVGALTLAVPQARGVEFYPSALEKGLRGERALKLALAEMYVQGVSTRKVAAITEELRGLEVTTTQVSRAQALDAELEKWRSRPLGETPYLILDARYENVRHGGQVRSCAVLTAIGIDPRGGGRCWASPSRCRRPRSTGGTSWPACRPGACTAQARRQRRPRRAQAGPGRPADRRAVAAVPVPPDEERPGLRAPARDAGRGGGRPAGGLRRPRPSRGRASVGAGGEEVPHDGPQLADWLEANVPEGLAVFAVPRSHRRRLRTSNMLERLNEELKRRTRVAGLFPNDASLLRLVSAVLMGVSEDWETNRKYLTMGPG